MEGAGRVGSGEDHQGMPFAADLVDLPAQLSAADGKRPGEGGAFLHPSALTLALTVTRFCPHDAATMTYDANCLFSKPPAHLLHPSSFIPRLGPHGSDHES